MAARRSKGEATYRKRPDGLWEGRISIEYKRYSRYGKTRTEAKEKIDALVKSINSKVVDSNILFGKWIELWLDSLVKGSNTHIFYESIFRLHITPDLGKYKLNRLTEDIIQKFVDKKKIEVQRYVRIDKETGEEIVREKILSSTTINHIANAVRTCLNAAIKKKALSINPAMGIEKPKIEQPDKKTLTVEEVKSLIDAADTLLKEEPLFLAVLLIPYTGCRRGEILGILRKNVDLSVPGIFLEKQIRRVPGGKKLDDLKTDSSVRFVPMTKRLSTLIEAHMASQPKIKKIVNGKTKEVYPEYLFCHPTGEPYHPDSLKKVTKRIMEKADITHLTPHELRHTYATLLLESGESDRVIAELMGHSSLAMLKRYAHVRNKLKISSVNRLEEHIEGSKKEE